MTDVGTAGMDGKVCDHCGKTFVDYEAVGYDGPAKVQDEEPRLLPDPDNQDCHMFMAWVTLCLDCAHKAGVDT